MSAVLGTFVSIKTMADGSPRIVLDLQCTLADIAALGMIPGTPFGIARISGESTVAPVAEEPKERAGQLCVMACNFCADKSFQQWVGAMTGKPYAEVTEEVAKEYILDICGVDSRKDIDKSPSVAHKFHNAIRAPYLEWRALA